MNCHANVPIKQWTAEETRALIAQIRLELRDKSIHAYQNV